MDDGRIDRKNAQVPGRIASRDRRRDPSSVHAGARCGFGGRCDRDRGRSLLSQSYARSLPPGTPPLLRARGPSRSAHRHCDLQRFPNKVYKSFVKMALTLVPQTEIDNFAETIRWVRGLSEFDYYPPTISTTLYRGAS